MTVQWKENDRQMALAFMKLIAHTGWVQRSLLGSHPYPVNIYLPLKVGSEGGGMGWGGEAPIAYARQQECQRMNYPTSSPQPVIDGEFVDK